MNFRMNYTSNTHAHILMCQRTLIEHDKTCEHNEREKERAKEING